MEAFINGWFRTGDQGFLDEKGCLTLSGRIKELINRGGEKISPLKMDAALLQHPSVAAAVCFGASDEKYGEAAQAAVVLSGNASEDAIRDFCRNHLADFKVPEKIYFVTEMPRMATGKIRRRHIIDRYKVGDGENAPISAKLEQMYHDVVRGRNTEYPEWRTSVY